MPTLSVPVLRRPGDLDPDKEELVHPDFWTEIVDIELGSLPKKVDDIGLYGCMQDPSVRH